MLNHSCQLCSAPAEKTCSVCSNAYYCSSDHQKQDWKTHKNNCKTISQEENDDLGRYYVATRNLRAGEVILLETPIIHAPTSEMETVFAMDKMSCFGCNRIFNGGHSQQCSKCKLYVCSATCEKMAVHSDNECKIFQNLKVTTIKPTVMDIFYLRTALVKKSNPVAFEGIMNLAHGLPKEANVLDMDKNVVKNILDCFGIEELLTVDEWLKIANVIKANKFTSSLTIKPPARGLKSGREYEAKWLYLCLEASIFAHSCSANCYLECTPLPKMEVNVRTCTAVKKGEILSIDYFGTSFFDTHGRQFHNKFFLCKCSRCKDPYELGSNLATLVCHECKATDMLSTDSIVKVADWKCNSCGEIGDWRDKMALISQISSEVLNMDLKEVGTKALSDKIEKLAGTLFHPNHWILVQGFLRLTNFLEDKLDSVDSEQYSQYVSSMERLISITSIIAPGISDQKAIFQYSLAKVLLDNVTTKKDQLETKLSPIHTLKTLERVIELLTEASKFFQFYNGTCHSNKSKTAIEIQKKLKFAKEMRTNISLPG